MKRPSYSFLWVAAVFALFVLQVVLPGCNSVPVAVPATVVVQPFDDIDAAQYNEVYRQLRAMDSNAILLSPISLPVAAYNPARQRYRADSLIAWLSRGAKPGQVVIGLTSKDISTTKGKIKDWGVIGLGYQPGRACVVSSFRLHKQNLDRQLIKICIHELGHTQGLSHCPQKDCYMRDAEGHNVADDLHAFCPDCTAKLRNTGWVLPEQ